MWKLLRVSLLAIVLLVVAGRYVLDRYYSRAWNTTLWIAVVPINADGSPAAARYIADLQAAQFASIESFFAREAKRWSLALARPVHVQLMPEIHALPPRLERNSGPLAVGWWSLRLRYYAWREGGRTPARVKVFVMYHDPARTPVVPHSLGLQKGLVGVVYAFATDDMTGANAIVIAHEVLHTLGAADRYDLGSGMPIYPDGYAQPDRQPRYPQPQAEVMAGRRALSATESEMPASLEDVMVGPATAHEINWGRP